MKSPSDLELALLALTVRELTGREIAKAYLARHGRELSYGSLYTTLRRMHETGWVRQRDDEDQDGRMRWYVITGEGRKAHELGIEKRTATVRLAGLWPEGVA